MKNYGNRKMWGNPRTKECFKDYRCFDESKWLLSKQNGVTERNRSQERHSHRRKVLSDDRAKHSGIPNYCGQSKGGGQSRYRSRWSDCQLTADALRLQQSICVPKKKLWYRRKEPVIGGRKRCWRKCITADSKGACWARDQNLWYPRRLRVPSLNKIAQTVVRPSPLWEFRAANCFRDFIVAWQNENPRRTSFLVLGRAETPCTRRSVAKSTFRVWIALLLVRVYAR